MQRLPVNDINLRLILSKDHEIWFRTEIRDRWVAITIPLVISFGTLASTLVWYVFYYDDQASIVYVDETVSAEMIKSFEEENMIVKQISDADPKDEAGPVFTIKNAGITTWVALIIASPFLLIFVFKAFLEIKQLMRWRTEHHEFLAAHGRAPT